MSINIPEFKVKTNPIVPLVLAFATWWAYFDSFQVPFVFDDIVCIETNDAIRSLWPPGPVVEQSNRPLLFLTLALNYAIDGLDVRGYHSFNLAVHIVAGLVLLNLVQRTLLLPRLRARYQSWAELLALAVALIWLVHPLQTQAVTYIVQRGESMMGLFFLLCLLCTLCGSQSANPTGWYVGSVVACWLGMATKEVMIAAPFVVALYDRVFLSESWKAVFERRWRMYAAFVPAQLALLLVVPSNLAELGDTSAGFGVEGLTFWQYLRSQPAVILHYLQLAVWPARLCFDYMWPVATNPVEIYGLGLVVLALLSASLLALRRWPALGFLGTSFFLILAPSSSLMPILDIAVEHRMYLPLAPLAVLAVFGLHGLVRRLLKDESQRRAVFVVTVLLLAFALVVRTCLRNKDYLSRQSIWSDVIAKSPHNFRGYFSLGLALQQQDEYGPAAECFLRAIELNPNYAKAHHSLGVVRAAQGPIADAIAHYEKAILLSSGYGLALRNYGNLLARERDYPAALEKYLQAIQYQPRDVMTHRLMAHTYFRVQRYAEAAASFAKALELEPDSVRDAAWLAWLYATAPDAAVRNADAAVRLANQAVRATSHKDIDALSVLAAAYAEAGRFEDARQLGRQTSALARAAGDEVLQKKIESRLRNYENKSPIRQGETEFPEP